MPNNCSYGVVATGPQASLTRLYELLNKHLDRTPPMPAAFVQGYLDTPSLLAELGYGPEAVRDCDQAVDLDTLALGLPPEVDPPELVWRGRSSWTPPIVLNYLARQFPDLTFVLDGDTEGDIVERWVLSAQGQRRTDLGSYDRHGETWKMKDGIDLATGQPTEFLPWQP
jgi:hypothetical protein